MNIHPIFWGITGDSATMVMKHANTRFFLEQADTLYFLWFGKTNVLDSKVNNRKWENLICVFFFLQYYKPTFCRSQNIILLPVTLLIK